MSRHFVYSEASFRNRRLSSRGRSRPCRWLGPAPCSLHCLAPGRSRCGGPVEHVVSDVSPRESSGGGSPRGPAGHAEPAHHRVRFRPVFTAVCRLPVPRDHPRCQQHGSTSRPHRLAGQMITATDRYVKRADRATSEDVARPEYHRGSASRFLGRTHLR